jgi:hypothetical protein
MSPRMTRRVGAEAARGDMVADDVVVVVLGGSQCGSSRVECLGGSLPCGEGWSEDEGQSCLCRESWNTRRGLEKEAGGGESSVHVLVNTARVTPKPAPGRRVLTFSYRPQASPTDKVANIVFPPSPPSSPAFGVKHEMTTCRRRRSLALEPTDPESKSGKWQPLVGSHRP